MAASAKGGHEPAATAPHKIQTKRAGLSKTVGTFEIQDLTPPLTVAECKARR